MSFCQESRVGDVTGAEGVHLIGDLYRCEGDSALFGDAQLLRATCLELCQSAELQVVGDVFHQFEAAGVTGCVLLAESHFAIHTWPENSSVTVDVYVCNFSMDNSGKAQQVFEGIRKLFAPADARIQCVQRGEA